MSKPGEKKKPSILSKVGSVFGKKDQDKKDQDKKEKKADGNETQNLKLLVKAISNNNNTPEALKLIVNLSKETLNLAHNNRTVLVLALILKNDQVAKALIKKGVRINYKTNSRLTPLISAVMHQNSLEVVKLLLEHGADMEAIDKDGLKAIDHVRDEAVRQALIEKEVELKQKGSKSVSELSPPALKLLEEQKENYEKLQDKSKKPNWQVFPIDRDKKGNINKQTYEDLSRCLDYSNKYVEFVRSYFTNHGWDLKLGKVAGELHISANFFILVRSLIGMTDGNNRLIIGSNEKEQDELFKEIYKFYIFVKPHLDSSSVSNLVSKLADEYKADFEALRNICLYGNHPPSRKMTIYDLEKDEFSPKELTLQEKYDLLALDNTDSKRRIEKAVEAVYKPYHDEKYNDVQERVSTQVRSRVEDRLKRIGQELIAELKEKKGPTFTPPLHPKKLKAMPKAEDMDFVLVSMVPGDRITQALNYNLQNFPTIKDHKKDSQTQLARSLSLVCSGEGGFNTPITFFCSRKIAYGVDSRKIYVPWAEFHALQTYGQVPMSRQPKNNFKAIIDGKSVTLTSKYDKTGVARYYRHTKDGSTYADSIEITDYSRYNSITKKIEKDGSPETFRDNVLARYLNEPKKEEYALYLGEKRDVRYGGRGEMSYPEALVVAKEGEVNPISFLMIDITGGRILQQEIDSVLKTLEDNSHLKLYFYDRSQKAHIIRGCNNERAQEILGRGASYVNSRYYFKKLPILRAINRQVSNVQKADTLADKAGEFLDRLNKEENFLKAFSKKDFEGQRKDLLFTWEGIGNIKDYDSLKKRFYETNSTIKNDPEVDGKDKEEDKIRHFQIFNDIVRERMIAEIAKKGPEGEEFARSYNKKFNEMHLDRFLSREEYIEARDKMRESIETRFVIDKAGEFLDHIDKEENFLEAFSKKDFEEQRKDLLYVWGGKGKIKFYESLKERFDAENPSKEDTKDKRHPRQIFNDIVKKRMVKAIAQNGEQGELFAANYRSMMELHDLNSSVNLTVEQYLTAKEEMQKFISDYRVEETKAGPDPRGEEKKQARGETLDEKKKNSEMEKIENQTSPSRVPAPTNKTTTLAEKGKNHGKPALPGT